MPLVIPCPSCKARLKAPENLIGKTVKCPNCQAAIPVRAAAAPAPAPVPKKTAPANDFDFEDEPAPPPKKGGPVKKARDEYMDDEPPPRSKAKTKPSARDDFDDLQEELDDFDDDQPKKKAKKGKGRSGGPSGSTTEQDRQNAFFVYLFAFLGGFVGIGPLGGIVWWFMKRGESRFVDHHGKEYLNMMISFFLYAMGAVVVGGGILAIGIAAQVTALMIIGGALMVLLLMVLGLMQFIFFIIAMFKAKAGEWYRIPMIMHMLKV